MTSRHAAPSADTGRRRIVLVPGRDDLIDAALLLVLMTLAMVGFRTTYSGLSYLVAGVVGTLLGLLIAHLANVLRQPIIALAAMTLAVFFLAGGAVALHSSPVGGVLPTGSTLRVLSDETVHGWKDLLTTLPPVDGSGPLLVLPYMLGLLGGVGGFVLARRTAPSASPVAAPFAVLVAVILLGTQTPAAQLAQGALFGTVALGWITLRAQRRRPPLRSGSGRGTRLATVGVLFVVSLGGAALLGPHLPGSGAHGRTVLRSYVQPPFDVGQYPSPLAGFRKYTVGNKLRPVTLYSTPLFRVTGMSGVPVRIATLDDYNGLTWTAANQSPDSNGVADTFQRVGTDIDEPQPSGLGPVQHRSYSVTIEPGYADHYSDMWLPTAGATTRVQFSGARANQHADNFRYNVATGTGVLPDRVQAGDTYTAAAVVPSDPLLSHTDVVQTGAVAPEASGFLRTPAGDWSAGGVGPTGEIFALANRMYTIGSYTNGEPPNQQFPPGHSAARLLDFVNPTRVSGDDEQYAATFALMIEQLGTPARVVLGAVPEASGIVEGKDVHAWVEVQLANGTWRSIMTSTFMNRNSRPHTNPPPQPQSQTGSIVPPPSRGHPHSDLADANDATARSRVDQKHHAAAAAGGGLPAWLVSTVRWGGPPVLLIVLICASIVGAKALRRRRRRTRGTPAARLARGWSEIVDHARDLGTAMPAGRTRREQGSVLSLHEVGDLARAADAKVFGQADPLDHDVAEFWSQVSEVRKRMSRAVGLRRRWWAAVNVASLRRTSRVGGGAS